MDVTPPYEMWIEGKIFIDSFDGKRRSDAIRLRQLASELGFDVQVDYNYHSSFRRRRYVASNTSYKDLLLLVGVSPSPMTAKELAEALYETDVPWTPASWKAALWRLRVMINRIKRQYPGALIETRDPKTREWSYVGGPRIKEHLP